MFKSCHTVFIPFPMKDFESKIEFRYFIRARDGLAK